MTPPITLLILVWGRPHAGQTWMAGTGSFRCGGMCGSKTSIKLRALRSSGPSRSAADAALPGYQRRGAYPPPPIRFAFQTSPHRRQRQYDVALTVLLVVVSWPERQTGHAFGGSGVSFSGTRSLAMDGALRRGCIYRVFSGCSTSYKTRAMLSSALALTASPTTMTMPMTKPIVAAIANEENMETSRSCEWRVAEDFDEPGCPQDGREVSGKLT